MSERSTSEATVRCTCDDFCEGPCPAHPNPDDPYSNDRPSDAPAIVDVPAPLAELVSAATAYREATNAWACEGAERRMFKALDALPTLAARPDYAPIIENARDLFVMIQQVTLVDERAHALARGGADEMRAALLKRSDGHG